MTAKPAPSNPADVAREAFLRLATRRIAPTPQAYAEAYAEVLGSAPPLAAEGLEPALATFAARLAEQPGELGESGRRLQLLHRERDWEACDRTLTQVVDRLGRRITADLAPLSGSEEARQLRDLLYRALTFAVAARLDGTPALAQEAEALGAAARAAQTQQALADVTTRLSQLCYQIERMRGASAETQQLLLRLFRLLLANLGEQLGEGSPMLAQVQALQKLLDGPFDARELEDATRSLKELVFRQGQLRAGLADVKVSMQNMVRTFVDRLGSVAERTGEFHERLGGYSERIGRAASVGELDALLAEVQRETRQVQAQALESRESMVAARKQVEEAEARIAALEARLRQMNELVREDPLTGCLNRHGLEEVFAREAARADRRGTPLCVAMLDVDDFKRLNDTYGHLAGDAALRHLVQVARETLRTIDAVARSGGEEFLILMPETPAQDAAATMVRLQRTLTAHFFLHEHHTVLLTFSAGVALRRQDEPLDALLKRADRAMYAAKQSGKNRVTLDG